MSRRLGMCTLLAALVVAASLPTATAAARAPAPPDASDNVRLTHSFPYRVKDIPFNVGGSDLAFQGRFVYAAERGWEGSSGGVHIYDVSKPEVRKVGFAPCGGWQNDVAVVEPGLIAVGYHQGKYNCGNPKGGVTLIDVSNPRKPKILGSTAGELPPGTDPLGAYFTGPHTITTYPGKPIIYASPGGRQMGAEPVETIIDVSDPRRPKVVGTFDSGIGCHDLTFDIRGDRKLAFCAGPGETQIWDVADPIAPQLIGHIVNPLHNFHHSVAVSSDGRYAVVGTETGGNDCIGGPTGALFIYDVTNPRAPVMLGYFGAPRGPHSIFVYGREPEGDCAAHLFNLIPGTLTVVSGNYWGGMSVVDFSNPVAPREVAHYRTEDTNYWAAYWYRGRVFANGFKSFDVFDVAL
ncbi:MAG: hypothetical protein M3N53_15225 [Actinomycetota bacterium]|nr:hypothetical protein [Actinomycetota bacterium]